MPANNENVILSFLTRTPCNGSNLKAAYNEEGELCLYSYRLPIARITDADEYLLYDYRAAALGCVSVTTSQHVGKLHRLAEKWAGYERYKDGIAPYSIWSVYQLDRDTVSKELVGYTR